MEEIRKTEEHRGILGLTPALLGSTFAYAVVSTLMSVLLNDIIDTYALSGAAQGLMSSLMSAGMMTAFVINPLLQGRVQKMTMLLVSELLMVVMVVISGAAPVFGVFAVAIVLMGMGCGWLDSYLNSCIVDVHPADSPKYLSLLHGTYSIGSLLAPLAMTQLLVFMSWRGVHFATAGLAAVSLLFLTLVALRVRRAGGLSGTEEERLRLADIGRYLKNGHNVLLLVLCVLTTIVQNGLICWVVRYMTVSYNAEALGATCLSAYWICATINRFTAPRIHMRPLKLVILGALAGAVFLTVGVLSGSAILMCVMCGLTGLASGHFMPMMVAECAEGYSGNTTLTTSVSMLVMSVARVVTPLLMAFLTNAVSPNVGMLFPALSGALCAVIGFFALRKTGQSPQV